MRKCLRPSRATCSQPKSLRSCRQCLAVPSARDWGRGTTLGWRRQTSYLPSLQQSQVQLRWYSSASTDNDEPVPAPAAPQLKWVKELDPFLPPDLRHETSDFHLPNTEAKKCQEIWNIIWRAREAGGVDILSHMAIDLDRWPAAFYIFNRLLDHAESGIGHPQHGWLPYNIKWPRGSTLETISDVRQATKEEAWDADKEGEGDFVSLSELDKYTTEPLASNAIRVTTPYLSVMDQIWSSLGSIVLHATGLSPDHAQVTMSYVYRMLGRLHHSGFIPDDVYKYSESEGYELMPGRSPMLCLLASRIMSVLSEAEFNAFQAPGQASAKTSIFHMTMRQRQLGPEIWLEFILWCCVEGGFSRAGAWILDEMRRCPQQWSVRELPEFLRHAPSAFDIQLTDWYETWDDCVAHVGQRPWKFPTTPFKGIGDRTISRNVVMSVATGLVNELSVGLGHQQEFMRPEFSSIAMIKTLLDDNGVGMSPPEFFHIVMRILECQSVIPEVNAKKVDSLLEALTPASLKSPAGDKGKSTGLGVSGLHGFHLGVMQYLLNNLAESGHLPGAEELMLRLLPERSKAQLATHANNPVSGQATGSADLRDLLCRLTPLSMALLLNTSAMSRHDTFAYRLLFGDGKTPPIIPHEACFTPILAPAIIRFATAFKKTELLQLLAQYYAGNWTTAAIKAMVEYTIDDEDWAHVEKLLLYLRDSRDTHWGVSQIAQLAATIVRLDVRIQRLQAQDERARAQSSIERGLDLLARALRGHFSVVLEYTDHTQDDYQDAILFQLHKLFLSVPGVLSTFCDSFKVKQPLYGLSLSHRIPSRAFNCLLSAIVEVHGSAAGRTIWDNWCLEPWHPASQKLRIGATWFYTYPQDLISWSGSNEPSLRKAQNMRDRYNKIISPNVNTMRIIARQAMREIDALKHEEPHISPTKLHDARRILNWSKLMFKKFTYTPEDIEREIGGYQNFMRQVRELHAEQMKGLRKSIDPWLLKQ